MGARELIEKAEKLDRDATPGPWIPAQTTQTRQEIGAACDAVEAADRPVCAALNGNYQNDVAFIAEARALVPALAAALHQSEERAQRAEAELAEVAKILDQGNGILDAAEARIKTIIAERDEARDWVRRMTQDSRTLTCVYCGHAYPPGTPAHGSDVLTAHIEQCEKHPARRLAQERDAARAELRRLTELRPIAEAPRDGTLIIGVWIVDGNVESMDVLTWADMNMDDEEHPDRKFWMNLAGEAVEEPTHFRPLEGPR